MAERLQVNAGAKFTEHVGVGRRGRTFVEGEEVDRIVPGEFTQEMKRALEGPAHDRVGSVRIHHEDPPRSAVRAGARGRLVAAGEARRRKGELNGHPPVIGRIPIF